MRCDRKCRNQLKQVLKAVEVSQAALRGYDFSSEIWRPQAVAYRTQSFFLLLSPWNRIRFAHPHGNNPGPFFLPRGESRRHDGQNDTDFRALPEV